MEYWQKVAKVRNILNLEIADLMWIEEEGIKFVQFRGVETSVYEALNIVRKERSWLDLGHFHKLHGYLQYYLR